jgi:hypothetical protein
MVKTCLLLVVFFANISAFDGKNIKPLQSPDTNNTIAIVAKDQNKTIGLNYDYKFNELGQYHISSGVVGTVISGIGILSSIFLIAMSNGYGDIVIPSTICLAASSSGLVFGILEIRLGISLQKH